jgi:acetyl esterase/lipase
MMRIFALLALVGLATSTLAADPTPTQPPAKQKDKEKEPRPDMTAVLAKDTVVKKDVAFGKDEKQKLDVYSPKNGKDCPIVIFVHRGEWTTGDKSEVSYKPKFFNENGVVFISTNYRLYPDAKFPAHAEDVALAVRWAVDHAAEFGGDPKKIILMGHSAGCHLVTLVSLDPKYLAAVKLKPSDLRGVVAWSGGAYDLVAKVAEGGSYKQHITNAFGPDEAVWKDASPVTHAKNAAKSPPFLFAAHEKGGTAHKAAEKLAELIRDGKGKAEVIVLENRTHQTAIHLIGAPEDKTGATILKFLTDATK